MKRKNVRRRPRNNLLANKIAVNWPRRQMPKRGKRRKRKERLNARRSRPRRRKRKQPSSRRKKHSERRPRLKLGVMRPRS